MANRNELKDDQGQGLENKCPICNREFGAPFCWCPYCRARLRWFLVPSWVRGQTKVRETTITCKERLPVKDNPKLNPYVLRISPISQTAKAKAPPKGGGDFYGKNKEHRKKDDA